MKLCSTAFTKSEKQVFGNAIYTCVSTVLSVGSGGFKGRRRRAAAPY